MQILHNLLALLVVLLAFLANCESRRSAYRLPRVQGRSASGSPSPQDVGSGRDFMKKFMLMRGLFQQPPSDNVIVITEPSSLTYTTTPTTTTTTTTTTVPAAANNTGRSLQDADDAPEPPVTTMTSRALQDRLDLPEGAKESHEVGAHKQPEKSLQWTKKFNLKSAQVNRKRNLVKKTHRRAHKRPQKRKSAQKRKLSQKQSANQQRNTESAVSFIEPYHNDRGQSQSQSQSQSLSQSQSQAGGGQSTSDSRLQRIWRRFQIVK